MKHKIDQQMAVREQRHRNVKLGTGGIREIELIAQALQVSHGGRIPQVRTRNTTQALRALHSEKLISDDEFQTLKQAYVFLRDVENKLQMTDDAQTHSLPREEEQLTTHARRLGYTTADEFLRDYQRHTNAVN